MRLVSGNEAARVIKLLAAASKGYKYANKQKVRKSSRSAAARRDLSHVRTKSRRKIRPWMPAELQAGWNAYAGAGCTKGLHQPSAEEGTGPEPSGPK